MRSVRSSPKQFLQTRGIRCAICRGQRLHAGLGSVTAFIERAGRVLRRLGVQKAELQYETTLEAAVQTETKTDTEVAASGAPETGRRVSGTPTPAAGSGRSTGSSALSGAGREEAAAGAAAGAGAGSGAGSGAGDGSRSSATDFPAPSFTSSGDSRSVLPPSRSRAPLRLEVRVVDSIAKVSREEWDAVVTGCGNGEVNPFLLWSFLHALEESGSAAPRTGWLPQHILVRQLDEPGSTDGSGPDPASASAAPAPSPGSPSLASPSPGSPSRLVGCVPLYLKGHSYGEYVFDNSWADFAGMLGVRYYPKLQAAVPFTPVTGARLLVSSALSPGERAAVVRALGGSLIDMADSLGVSGVHLTFTSAQEWAVLGEMGFKQRLGMQFHWENSGYDTFDDFLGQLKQSKRKSIRQERKSIERAGLSVQRLSGSQLLPGHWDCFHDFYLSTVDRKWGNAYLTRDFFHRLGEDMADRVLLVVASESAPPSPSTRSPSAPPPASLVAAALNLVGSHALFGRNWGQAEGRDVRYLHFELCYYQALEEAISRRLPRVEAGAQGEHKLQRGYLPAFTYSCHYLRDPRLGSAVDRFLQRERAQMEATLQMMSLASSPYKKERTVEALVSKLQAYRSLSSGSGSGSGSDSSMDAE